MTVLLQISDPHFGTEQPPVVEALLRLAREVGPAAVVISGDITQRARRAQFEAARQFVQRLAPPAMLAIPGNHDIPLFNVIGRSFYPYAGFQHVFGEALEGEWQSEDFLVLTVNTTRPSRHKDGEVSGEQIRRVSERLTHATQQQIRIVVTHQPVFVLRGSEIHNVLHGHTEAIQAWAAAGADVIMGGHIHLPYIAPLHEHYSALPRRCWVVQAGTAVSSRVRAHHPNSVNLLKSQDGAVCVAERWDYSAERNEFHCVKAKSFDLDRSVA